jgi:hypothetical protein
MRAHEGLTPTMKPVLVAVLLGLLHPQEVEVTALEPTTDPDGVLHVRMTSSAQSKPVDVRLLVPSVLPEGKDRRFLYILPVEPGGETRYGDGLAEARRLGIQEKHGMIVVAPSFAELPWYADHPTNPRRRDEAHLLRAVLPWVEKRFPSKSPKRLLLGFSKSGWGAWSLLLRHPDLFDAAAAWDAPLMKEKPDQFGMDRAFATEENFQAYRLTGLLREKAGMLRDRKRLAHFGYGNFREHHQKMQALLLELKIPADYSDGPSRQHLWESGWMPEAVAALEALSR